MGRVDVDTSWHHIDVDHFFTLDLFEGGGPEGSSEDEENSGLSEAVVDFSEDLPLLRKRTSIVP